MLLGKCPRAVVCCLLCALFGFAAPGGRCCLAPVPVPWLWLAACLSGVPPGPAWCAAPRPVQSLSVLRLALPMPWCPSPPRGLAPPDLPGVRAGHAEADQERGSLCMPLAPAEAVAPGSLCVVPVRGPAIGLSLAGASGVGLVVRALRWLACVYPVTYASRFPYQPSFDGGLGQCTRAVPCARLHLPLRVGGRHAWVPCVCACARLSWPGRAGRPPGRILVRLTFSFGRCFFLLCLAPSRLRLPLSWSFVCPPPLPLSFFSPLLFSARPLCLLLSFVFGPRCPGPRRCVFFVLLALRFSALRALLTPSCCPPSGWLLSGGCPPPSPFCVSRFLLPPLGALRLFFLFFFVLLSALPFSLAFFGFQP